MKRYYDLKLTSLFQDGVAEIRTIDILSIESLFIRCPDSNKEIFDKYGVKLKNSESYLIGKDDYYKLYSILKDIKF